MPRRVPIFVLALVVGSTGFAHLATAAEDEAASETAGRWLSGTNEGVQAFGAGGPVGGVTAKSFVDAGTGSTKRALSRSWNATFDSWRGLSAATKESLPYRVAPAAFMASDIATSVVAPAMEGDGKGALSGAANIGVSALAVAQGSAAGAKLFGAVGGAVGSFFPVVGTAAGAVVGGAVGTVAGGFIASIAYDRYGKSIVGKVVEGGISALFDPDPLMEAMRAREDFLRKQAAPELAKEWAYNESVGASFGQEEEQLFKPLRGVYQPTPAAPATQADLLNGASRFAIEFWAPQSPPEWHFRATCNVTGTAVSCAGGAQDSTTRASWKLNGEMGINRFSGPSFLSMTTNTPGCSSTMEFRTQDVFLLLPGGKLDNVPASTHGHFVSVTGCGNTAGLSDYDSPGTKVVGTWHAASGAE